MNDNFYSRSLVFKSLAHPSRLKIIEAVASEARCVFELTAVVEADFSTVSKHLAILRSAGIVRGEKRGTHVYYRLRMPCVLEFMRCVDHEIVSHAEWQVAMSRKHGERTEQ